MKNLRFYYYDKDLWLKDLNYFKKLGETINAGINSGMYWIRVHDV